MYFDCKLAFSCLIGVQHKFNALKRHSSVQTYALWEEIIQIKTSMNFTRFKKMSSSYFNRISIILYTTGEQAFKKANGRHFFYHFFFFTKASTYSWFFRQLSAGLVVVFYDDFFSIAKVLHNFRIVFVMRTMFVVKEITSASKVHLISYKKKLKLLTLVTLSRK